VEGGADGFRVNVLCQQPIGAAIGKAFFAFLLRQPSPTAAVLKLLCGQGLRNFG
jgi:hypothetical protein